MRWGAATGAQAPAAEGAGLRVLLVTGAGLPAAAGDVAGARRLAEGLRSAGAEVAVLPADRLQDAGEADVVHAFHAVHAGLPAAAWCPGGRALVWTFTGTDVCAESRIALQAALPGVRALVTYHAEALAQLRALLPECAGRLRAIAPGVDAPRPVRRASAPLPPFPGGNRPLRRRGEVVFLLPAGLRSVKDPDLAVSMVEHVRSAGVPSRLWVAGALRDPGFAAAFLERIVGLPFVQYVGEVPPDDMPRLYHQADIVLNTSRSEGMSNALLEAMAHGRPVLATDIPGNRAAIRNGHDGVLATPADMMGAALTLAQAPHFRRRLAAAARRTVGRRFDPRAEVSAHVALYRAVLSAV